MSITHDGLLQPGRNCWRIERAERLAFDGAAYFAALRSAIARAKHSVFILGWDFGSRIRLLENQYFSSSMIGRGLAARLRKADAPEVVVVSRLNEEGWLERARWGCCARICTGC